MIVLIRIQICKFNYPKRHITIKKIISGSPVFLKTITFRFMAIFLAFWKKKNEQSQYHFCLKGSTCNRNNIEFISKKTNKINGKNKKHFTEHSTKSTLFVVIYFCNFVTIIAVLMVITNRVYKVWLSEY